MWTTVGELAAGKVRRGPRRRGRGIIAVPHALGDGLRDRVHEQLGVGVLRLIDHQIDRTRLGDRAMIEHEHVVADLVAGCQIVGDR